MKKLFILILVLFLLSGAFGCSNGSVQEPSGVEKVTQRPAENTSDNVGDAEKTEPADTPTEAPEATDAPSGEVTVEETVLVDEKDVRITVKSLDEDSIFGPELKLLVENDSGKSLIFSIRNVSVNGYMNDAYFYAEVADGKKANDTLRLSDTDLEECGITTIADIELCFHIYESDGWDEYYDTDPISIKTSAYEGFEYVYDDSGFAAYEGNGIRIIVKGLTDRSIFGPGVLFYIENNTDKNITVTSRDVSVNGFMVDDLLYCDVAAGKRAVDASTFLESSLEENGIEEIEEIELYFHIYDTGDWDTIVDTDTVKISFN